MKNLAIAAVLLATTMPLIPVNPDPMDVRIDVKPRMAKGIIPVRTMPYHATATISNANTSAVIGQVDLDLQPGETKTRTETVSNYKITFQAKIASDGLRAAAVATVLKSDQLISRQATDVSLER